MWNTTLCGPFQSNNAVQGVRVDTRPVQKDQIWTLDILTNLHLIKAKALSIASQKRTSSRETDLAVLSIWDPLRYSLKGKLKSLD